MKNNRNENIVELVENLETDSKDLIEYIQNDKNVLAKSLIDYIIDNLNELKKELNKK